MVGQLAKEAIQLEEREWPVWGNIYGADGDELVVKFCLDSDCLQTGSQRQRCVGEAVTDSDRNPPSRRQPVLPIDGKAFQLEMNTGIQKSLLQTDN